MGWPRRSVLATGTAVVLASGTVAWLALGPLACGNGAIGPNEPVSASGGSGGAGAHGGQAGSSSTSQSSSSDGGTGGEPPAPFVCEQTSVGSPVLVGEMLFDPAEPHPGDTVTVIVRSTNGTKPAAAPAMVMQAEGADGTVVEQMTMKAGGGDTLYYYAIADVRLGDVCLVGLIDAATPEISGKVTVTERPAGPPVTNGIYKVVQNHQWTCGEQPTYGNEVHVYVRDENGKGVPGAQVSVHYADSTDPGSIYNGDKAIPESFTTDTDGFFLGYDYWPISDHGLLVFQLSVLGEPSDIATELTTGWWETNDSGCNYCGEYGKNVWGHWSHTIVFQRDLAATDICRVETDHAGQQSCALPGHLHHHPQHRACWPAQ